MTMCRFPGCRFQAHAKGLCGTHDYQRKRGIPLHAVVSRRDEVNDGLTATQREYRRRKEAGQCVRCQSPARPGKVACLSCKNTRVVKDDVGDGSEGMAVERCACGLMRDEDHLACDLPRSAAAYAQRRMGDGEASIVLRSKAA